MKKRNTLMSISEDQFSKIKSKATKRAGSGSKKKGLLL
jgi:hypothetical protein